MADYDLGKERLAACDHGIVEWSDYKLTLSPSVPLPIPQFAGALTSKTPILYGDVHAICLMPVIEQRHCFRRNSRLP
jgi:hypothetical protein